MIKKENTYGVIVIDNVEVSAYLSFYKDKKPEIIFHGTKGIGQYAEEIKFLNGFFPGMNEVVLLDCNYRSSEVSGVTTYTYSASQIIQHSAISDISELSFSEFYINITSAAPWFRVVPFSTEFDNSELSKIVFKRYDALEYRLDDGLKLSLTFGYSHNFSKMPAPSCLLYTSPSPRDATLSRMPSSA